MDSEPERLQDSECLFRNKRFRWGGEPLRRRLASESLTQFRHFPFREGQWVTVFFGFEPNSRPGRQGRVRNSLRFSRLVTGLKSRREFVIGLPARSGSVPGRTRQVGHARGLRHAYSGRRRYNRQPVTAGLPGLGLPCQPPEPRPPGRV